MIFYNLLGRLPFPLLYGVAWLAYLVIYYLHGYRKAVVAQNLRQAFPDLTDRDITKLSKRFYQRLCQVALEIVKAQHMSNDDFRRRVIFTNPELVEKYSNGFTNSVIILTIHQANWEWMLHGATTALNTPIDAVYKPLHNKKFDKLIFDIRSKFGSKPLPKEESIKDMIRRRREYRLFVMVADQSPVRSERSHWTTFMNGEAAFYLGAEAIAKLTKFPVLFARCRRLKTGYYAVEFQEVDKPPYDKNDHQITDNYVRLTEQAIRDDPESWLWSNRRWKRNRAEEDARRDSEES